MCHGIDFDQYTTTGLEKLRDAVVAEMNKRGYSRPDVPMSYDELDEDDYDDYGSYDEYEDDYPFDDYDDYYHG